MRNRFLSNKHFPALIREEKPIALISVMSKYKEKKSTKCLEALKNRPQNHRSGLQRNYSNEIFLQNRLINAPKDVDTFGFYISILRRTCPSS